MQLSVTRVSLKHFTTVVLAREKGRVVTLVTEHSDLNNADLMQRLYDDAADRGFEIESHLTGRVHRFCYSHDEVAGDDLLSRVFKPVDRTCPVKEVTVLND